MRTRSTVVVVAVLAATVGMLAGGVLVASASADVVGVKPGASGGVVTTVEEDEDGWDCATMSNKICGESSYEAGWVDACLYGYHMENIDYDQFLACVEPIDRVTS